MKNIRQLLEAKGLGRIADVVVGSKKPSIRFSATGSDEIASTRLGGRPNLPPDLDWPRWGEQPLAFLAQIDLPALPGIESSAIPREGSLFFFHLAGEDAPWGLDVDDRGSSCVKYSLSALRDSELRPFPPDLEEERQYHSVALGIEPVEDAIPDSRDQVIEELSLQPKESQVYEEVWEEWNSHRPDLCHRMGGYPDRLQGDLRLEAQLVSHDIFCDSRGYSEARQRGLWPGAKEWELLLQIDSESAAGMMWGDYGRIYYLIHRDDLEQRKFDKTWARLQCM